MPSASTAEIRAWAQANGHAVKDRGPIPAEVSAAYQAAASSPKRRSSKATPAPPAPVAALATLLDEEPGPRPLEPVEPMADPNVDVLVGRVIRLEQQVAELTARLDTADTARAASLRKSRFGRRS